MTPLLPSFWIAVILGGLALLNWFANGSWNTPGGTLLEHDMLRFAPLPVLLTICWTLLLIATALISRKVKPRNPEATDAKRRNHRHLRPPGNLV